MTKEELSKHLAKKISQLPSFTKLDLEIFILDELKKILNKQ